MSPPARDDGRPASTSTRRWWFRGIAILIGLLPLIVVESIARISESPSQDAIDFSTLIDVNDAPPLFLREGNQWTIDPERSNFFRPASFAANKSARTKRIFVLGGSTVQGRPYETETAFSTWLQIHLSVAQPQTTFEVVNCGGVSYASYRIEGILREVLGHEPDAIVIYTGHNEFLEDREYAEVRRRSTTQRWIDRIAWSSAAVRWVKRRQVRPPTAPEQLPSEVVARLDDASGMQRYVRDPDWRWAVTQHFDQTLERMVESVVQARVPLILCLPASDVVDTPPMKVAFPKDWTTTQRRDYQVDWNRALDPAHDPKLRREGSRRILSVDAKHAGAHYVLGRTGWDKDHESYLSSVEFPKHLIAARDLDVCPLRATTPILKSIRTIANRRRIPLVDVPRLFASRWDVGQDETQEPICKPEWFIDHVHPTISGHMEIAKALLEPLAAYQLIPADLDPESVAVRQAKQQHLAGLDETYFQRGKSRLQSLRRWAAGRTNSKDQ